MTTPTRKTIEEYALNDPIIQLALTYFKEGTLSYEQALMTALVMQTDVKNLTYQDFSNHLAYCTMSHSNKVKD